MRRTVATLLVVASPLLLATPVGAGDGHVTSGPTAPPVTAAAPTVRAPAVPNVAPATLPALPAPVTMSPPMTAQPMRPAVKPTRTKPRAAVAAVADSAYTAKLQAELCAARQIFCGLGSNGRYPTR
ncbi:MAG TPA: hypothetical protein VEG38_19620 [Acidimicrobiia bacterium]|nr:hypothetical protein [Acidimicrobiia bacterium]